VKHIFYLIFFLTIALPGVYSALRMWHNLSSLSWIKWLSLSFYLLLFISLAAGFFAEKIIGSGLQRVLLSAGFSFVVATVYFALFFLAFDLLMIIFKLSGLLSFFSPLTIVSIRQIFVITVLLTTTSLMLWGKYRYNNPVVTERDIDLRKGESSSSYLKVVIASDLHLGDNIRVKELERFVSLINAQKPDIVLLPGDITDNELKPLAEQNMKDVLSRISAPYGVFAVPGNHEFYGGEKMEIINYLESAGIAVLADSSALAVNGEVTIIGRDDVTNRERLSLKTLMEGIDKDKVTILMDHQPIDLSEAEEAGPDIQISGHTHNGQFWPGNLVVKKIFELGYGYKKKSETHFIVTSGLGLWGPKYRIGTDSEIVLINLKY